MTLEEIRARLEEIRGILEKGDSPDIEKLTAEVTELEARKKELAEIETRKKNAEALQEGLAHPETKTAPITDGRKDMYSVDSKEY